MEGHVLDNGRERIRRPIRNKRYSRRAFSEDKRPPKRLFTPEIKRFLKGWLVRRRENPYPNRDEKKMLAIQTGLTYIQVCNWFANWRRKLKNAGKEPQRHTWGDLIKTYNNQVQGNVEHFSICSDDSIWEEQIDDNDPDDDKFSLDKQMNSLFNPSSDNQCYFISSSTDKLNHSDHNPFGAKYKSHIMEKYLNDCRKTPEEESKHEIDNKPEMISKWLESAANFKPNESSYLDWTLQPCTKKKKAVPKTNLIQIHGKEELDAAEALTTLANSKHCHNEKT